MTRHCCRIGKVSSFQLLISAGPGPYAFGSTPARKPGYMGRAIWVLRTRFLGSVKRSADSVLANPCSAPFPPWLCYRPHRRRCPHSLTQTWTSGSAGATCICGLCSPGAAVRPRSCRSRADAAPGRHPDPRFFLRRTGRTEGVVPTSAFSSASELKKQNM